MEQLCNHKPNGFQFIQPGTQKRTLEDPDNNPVRASITAETNGRPIYTTSQQSFIQYIPPVCGDPKYVSSTPSKRDAQDKQQTADLLQQEVQQLQAKVQRSIEESERLRRLSLELQFQKRLEEFQQNGEEDDDYESDSGAGRKWFQTGSDVVRNCENTETPADQQKESPFTKEASLKDGVKCESTGYDKTSSEKFRSGEVDHKSFKTRRAPENLTFKERQQLFSLAMVTSSKVKVS
ncbi:afadin-like [Sinocyclocheilus rhinocerous]|uniref:afadin-like n=1 Tax=Sinocyclocheilus rhinocerous TaxID=307959 RepID=UPI0007B914D1|nr:PREDICTED: afadin-like [Sinocyclocheilus rhinocerous]